MIMRVLAVTRYLTPLRVVWNSDGWGWGGGGGGVGRSTKFHIPQLLPESSHFVAVTF